MVSSSATSKGLTGSTASTCRIRRATAIRQTSDGIFVFTGVANTVAVGDLVRVTGFARERFEQTSLNGANSNTEPVQPFNIVKCGTGSVAATDVWLPFADAVAAERYEGMLVRLPQPLVISEYFNFDRFGEIVLGLPRDGEKRLITPTVVEKPGAAANLRAADNALRQITLDDGLGIQNPPVLRHPNGMPFSLDNRFRGGDTVQNVTGVLGFDFSVYRIQPTAPAEYVAANPRPDAAPAVGGSIRVASMNTLNFFLTLNPAGGPLDNKCGGGQNLECRGADADQPTEFQRQRDKLLTAIASIGGDVIGLNEIENTPGVEPLGDPDKGIVAGLNSLEGAGTYAFIDTKVIGTDAIRVGMIYKPEKVQPVGAFAILDSTVDPRFIDTKSRPSLAQTFEVLATGARFTVVVNHFKSKGSDCLDVDDPDTGDGQGNCNGTRTAAAAALMDWIATDPTGSGDADVLVVGDLNSYAKEDPVKTIHRGADGTRGTLDDFTNLSEVSGGRRVLVRVRRAGRVPGLRTGECKPQAAGARGRRVPHQRRRTGHPRLRHHVQAAATGCAVCAGRFPRVGPRSCRGRSRPDSLRVQRFPAAGVRLRRFQRRRRRQQRAPDVQPWRQPGSAHLCRWLSAVVPGCVRRQQRRARACRVDGQPWEQRPLLRRTNP